MHQHLLSGVACCCNALACAVQPDGESVCIIIPATPHLQQEQQTLWQHQRQYQQQQAAAHASQPTSPQQQQQQHSAASAAPATAANLSPMMLVLRWRSLGLVAAPLVSNLGLVALTSSSVTLDAADAVVAAAVVTTAPALAPAAADTVVLAVMRSGWMWAGSLAGSSLSQVRQESAGGGAQHSTARHSPCGRLQVAAYAGDWWGYAPTLGLRAIWHTRQQSVSMTFVLRLCQSAAGLGEAPCNRWQLSAPQAQLPFGYHQQQQQWRWLQQEPNSRRQP